MPPKTKVPARRASGKRVRISSNSIIPSTLVSPSGRKMRQASVGISYKLTATRSPRMPAEKLAKRIKGAQDTNPAGPKRRGRPPVNPPVDEAAVTATKSSSTLNSDKPARGKNAVVDSLPMDTPKSPKRKREVEEEPAPNPPRKRGRPPKPKSDETSKSPRKPLAQKVNTKVQAQAGAADTTTPLENGTAKAIRKRGRPLGSKNKTEKVKPKETKKASKTKAMDTADFVESLTQPEDQGAPEFQYWLMKAEPDTRIEKGVDVAFSIDNLAAATEPEPWDGVRNAVARNNMRSMRKGDLAFFYHSNCAVPGIVGVMRIAEEHSVDESAFDPTHPYYDEKSNRDKPKWDCVKVEFVKKFQNIITLRELKSTPELAQMQIAQKAYGRLSVQSVTPDQWQFVLKMASEPEDLGVTSTVSGYEADTNGETDKEAVEDSVGGDDLDASAEADKITTYGDIDDQTADEADDQDAKLNGEEGEAKMDGVGTIETIAKEPGSGEA